MTKPNRRLTPAHRCYALDFPDELANWLATNGDLVDALLRLDELGDEAAEAVDAVRSIRRVAVLRFSIELWCALVEGDGDDPEELLLERIPVRVLRALRRALGTACAIAEPHGTCDSSRMARPRASGD
jgi:hypothetical protein